MYWYAIDAERFATKFSPECTRSLPALHEHHSRNAEIIGERKRGSRDTLHTDQSTEFENQPVQELHSALGYNNLA